MLLLTILGTARMNAQVTIRDYVNPHPCALLDLVSSSKGLLLPRIALNGNKNLFVLDGDSEKSQAAGMLVYNSVDNKIYFWDGSKWALLEEMLL